MAEPKISAELRSEASLIGTPKDPMGRRAADLAAKVKNMDAPTRAAAAVALAVEGAGYTDIARVLEYRTPMEARRAVWDALGSAGVDADSAEQKRTLIAKRLDKLLYSVMRRGTNPDDPDHLSYARLALAVIDRQARLYGLDAPQQMVVYTPAQAELNAYVAEVKQLMAKAAGGEEFDIIEGEIVGEEAAAS